MDLDLLDKNYPMVVSKLPFEKLSQAGLTGLSCRSNRVLPDLPNSGVNNYPIMFLPKKIHNVLLKWLSQILRIMHRSCAQTM
jgi:hypothetical protein